MLDIKSIRQDPEIIKKRIARKKADPGLVDRLLEVDKKRRELRSEVENIQSEINKSTNKIASLQGSEKVKAIAAAKNYSENIEAMRPELDLLDEQYTKLMMQIPNPPADDVIDGNSDKDNTVNRKWGKSFKFDFEPKDHVDLGTTLDLIDIQAAGKTSGSRFFFLKNELAILEMALFRYAFDVLTKDGFIPVVPPIMLNRKIMEGAGYLPGGEDEIYRTQDDTYLAGTAEQPLAGYHMDSIISADKLPLRYVGVSTCFRREAGSYGKDVRGILRAHQFNKVEMFSYVKPEDSIKEHEYLVSLEEKLMQGLGLPYQVVNICAGDLGDSASKKFDIEAWMPGEGKYRETHSCSNCTDFQARRLNIRYKDKGGKINFIHTLNGTAFSDRPLIAIIENYQQKDGSIKVPEVLQNYTGFTEIRR